MSDEEYSMQARLTDERDVFERAFAELKLQNKQLFNQCVERHYKEMHRDEDSKSVVKLKKGMNKA